MVNEDSQADEITKVNKLLQAIRGEEMAGRPLETIPNPNLYPQKQAAILLRQSNLKGDITDDSKVAFLEQQRNSAEPLNRGK